MLKTLPFTEPAISTPHPAPGSKALGGALVLALFVLAYAMSLTFVYIEGDDATSIAYHAMGRIADLQPPYSAYQSMMDSVLRRFPADEHVLRVGGMLITALAAPVVAILVGMLALAWAPGLVRIPAWAAILLVPVLAPEFIYLGLVYTPALVAMACVLGAHLLLRQAIERSGTRGWEAYKNPRFAISILIFAAGAACRWDIVAYGAVIVADVWLAVGHSRPSAAERKEWFPLGVIWGGLALLAWLIIVALNGYTPLEILEIIRTRGPVESFPGVLVMAATLQTFATPALALLGVIGFAMLLIRRDSLAILVVLGLILVGRNAIFGVPKWILVASPGIVTCALIGCSSIWTAAAGGWRKYALRAALIACLAAPWFVGVETARADSAYGPGFQVRPFDRPVFNGSFVKATLGAGALIPTSEGPRPLGGHAFVLFAGEWRAVVAEADQEQERAIQEALSRKLPLMWDEGEGYAVPRLLGMHFRTQDSWKRTIGSTLLVERRFTSEDGKQTLKWVRYRKRQSLFNPADLQQWEPLEGGDKAVIYGYTSTLRKIYQVAPKSLEKLGTSSAVLDLRELQRAVAGASNGGDSSKLSLN